MQPIAIENISDLETAKQVILQLQDDREILRQTIAEMAADQAPVDGEHTVFLDEEHERMLQILYQRRKLCSEQEDDAYHEEYEFGDVFTDFVEGYLDVAWDMMRDEDGAFDVKRPPTA